MKIDLSGRWSFDIDPDKIGIDQEWYRLPFLDAIQLPGTVASNGIGEASQERAEGYLTDPLAFEGYTWYARYLNFDLFETHEYALILERTRIAHVWVDATYVDSRDSLVSPHEYDLSPFITKKKHRVTICVDNSKYPIKGGHMTSPDTQTNWNGITGEIYLEARTPAHLRNIYVDASYLEKKIDLHLILHGSRSERLDITLQDGETQVLSQTEQLKGGSNTILIKLPDTIEAWSEFNPKLYQLILNLDGEETSLSVGIRDFKAVGRHFEINGQRTFLRGKHDGLIFPLTGYAPTDVDSWLKVMQTAKDYGINHYRFHTACPPKAAFIAADMLGIYMEPELPFWGTMTVEADEEHDASSQAYLISEGFRMLDAFGNHPSFVMFSMGNELWGSKERINDIISTYKHYDPRPLYTAGSNNFQFMPEILEAEDFFCGVRLSKDRLIRGSYAMCDAPQGHIQTEKPNSAHNYDALVLDAKEGQGVVDSTVQIQYGTGTKTVSSTTAKAFVPEIPIVTHEIGQYAMYPNFNEIEKYTGVLKPYNLEIFRERIEEKGLLDLADDFHLASGHFAVALYKQELEAAISSNELAGYQILDLQDFPGQGTALVGILDAFMDSKGLVTKEEWQMFCAPTVVLGLIDDFVKDAGTTLECPIKLAHYGAKALDKVKVNISLRRGEENIETKELSLDTPFTQGVHDLGKLVLNLPELDTPEILSVWIEIEGMDVKNNYDLYVYPKVDNEKKDFEVSNLTDAKAKLMQGESVVLYLDQLDDSNSLEGTYCTDFWCYPMFRRISESMGKDVPVGTHGLLIDPEHPIFENFPTDVFSTPQWYDIVESSRAQILDDTTLRPIVSTIDNFERNHNLGLIWEANAGSGKLLVVTSPLEKLESMPAKWLRQGIQDYLESEAFAPLVTLDEDQLNQIF